MSSRILKQSPSASQRRKRPSSLQTFVQAIRAALFRTTDQPSSSIGQSELLNTDVMDMDAASHNPATPLCQIPGILPHSVIPEHIDPLPIAQAALMRLRMGDKTLLIEDALWRDLFAMTGTTRTFAGIDNIWTTWKELCAVHNPSDFRLAPQGGATIIRAMPTLHWIQVKFAFQTQANPKLNCLGLMRLIPTAGEDWKVWFFTTLLSSVDGFPNVDHLEPASALSTDRPPTPVSPHGDLDNQNCVIVGAGMAGLCLAGYMKAVGCPAIVLERSDVLGQVWEGRYDSVSIHTSKACGQMPFENVWGPEIPYHLGKDQLVQGYRTWTRKYLPNEVWLSTTLIKADWNDATSKWTLHILQHGISREIKTKHLVFALGLCTLPYLPNIPNRERFRGGVLHGSEYRNARDWKGLKAVIVGAANTAHDTADDMLKAGLESVTIVQRSATPVLPVEYYRKVYDAAYNDNTPVAVSDAMMLSTPTAITRLMAKRAISKMMSAEPARFEALEKQGFKAVKAQDFDMYHCLLERFGSHYIDVGVSKKIADGLIKVKSDAKITGYTEKGLAFDDGTELEADVILFATGFEGNMKKLVAPLLDKEVSTKLHDFWCVDDEGEIRGAWKPIGHPQVWYTGGNVLYMRYMARFLAMSLAADIKGCPLPVYEKQY